MAVRDDPWTPGTPCWSDIAVPDVDAGVAFYRAVLGWDLVDMGEEFGHYRIAQVDGRAVAGLGAMMGEGQRTAWNLYFATDDTDAGAQLVTEHGGTVFFPPTDIPGTGRVTIAADPTGAVFGLWQSLGMIGAGRVNEPGALVWEDARLTDVDAGRRFYTAVFGHTFDPIPGLPAEIYGTFSVQGEVAGGLGGMMGAPEGTPSHWLSYFAVPDVDAAVATVFGEGGSIVTEAQDSPFGRMSQVTDPFGATFALHGPNTGSIEG